MAYPFTESGYNMFDMLSMIQKAIRRADYEHAGFAAEQLKGRYRSTMWNRLVVVTSEDCYGVLTKEIIELRKQDEAFPNDQNISNALALMCRAKKSRDACYFACNFILANRRPMEYKFSGKEIAEFHSRIDEIFDKVKGKKPIKLEPEQYDQFGFFTGEAEDDEECQSKLPELEKQIAYNGMAMEKALLHKDMDMIGYHANFFRENCRDWFWPIAIDYCIAIAASLLDEISALRIADDIVNKRKKPLEKDNIFIAKALMLMCYFNDARFQTVLSSDVVEFDELVDWSRIRTKPISECKLKNGCIPDWVYDCHTLKGKKMGKTDWDMTVSEQAALTPLQLAYFDEASWLYTYEQDVESGALTEKGMQPIREYAKTHPVNPVPVLPYD